MDKTPIRVICGREVQKSLKESSFAVLTEEIKRCGYGNRFHIRESDGTITSHTGARAVFIGMQKHTIDSIKSYENYHWAWIEEAQSISKKSLDVLIPTLRTDGWFQVDLGGAVFKFPLKMFLYSMNPYSWDDPINLVLPESREDTRYIQINYNDNPWFPDTLDKERREAKKVMTSDEYLRIWEGVPFDNAEDAVMSRTQVQAAMFRKGEEGGIVVGADIARFGDDRTVFVKRVGLQVVDIKIMEHKDTQQVAKALKDYSDGAKIIVDDSGVGGGVTDRLREMGCNVMPVNFGAKAQDKKKYPDIISEMWFNLANVIDKVGLPNNNELLTELSSRHFSYTADERRKVESKKEYKKRTGKRSPDIADAMILCFYQPRRMSIPNNDVRRKARI